MRRSVVVRIDERALERLADLAQRERRRPADQAALIIEQAVGVAERPESSQLAVGSAAA